MVDAVTTAAESHLDDVRWLLRILANTGAEAHLHVGCWCEWGSRGERMRGKDCEIDARLAKMRGEETSR